MRCLPLLPLALLAVAGCSSPEQALGDDTYAMVLQGVPTSIGPGAMFNVTVEGHMGSGMAMHERMSDHIGAHFWAASQGDPTAALPSATTCVHQGGTMPGTYRAQCTAPMQPGTYYMRAHARMTEGEGMMHHWWSGEQEFTVREEPAGSCAPSC